MKKIILNAVLGLLLLMGSGCSKFEPATMDLDVTPVFYGNVCLLKCEANITDNGGCKYINEMGFLFSLMPEPKYREENVITVVADEKLETTSFDLDYQIPLLDTIYYVRAYTCTNAGTGYSDIKMVSTHVPN